MYICEEHGQLESEWCDICEKHIRCDCKDQTCSRVKDIEYEWDNGSRSITINIFHCETCGLISHIEERFR